MNICNRPLETRRQKARKGSSSGGHKHGIKARWGEVQCEIHGSSMAGASWKAKQVKTNIPMSKKDRGCPQCKTEQAKN